MVETVKSDFQKLLKALVALLRYVPSNDVVDTRALLFCSQWKASVPSSVLDHWLTLDLFSLEGDHTPATTACPVLSVVCVLWSGGGSGSLVGAFLPL